MTRTLDPNYPPFRYVVVEVEPGHAHMGAAAWEEDIEECAATLAEGIRNCSPSRHKGHGRHHSAEQAEAAYRTAVTLLTTGAFDPVKDWRELHQKMWLHRLWGNKQAPAAVFLPTQEDPSQWTALITNPKTGLPQAYPVRPGAFKDFAPVTSEHMVPDEAGIGFRMKPKLPQRLNRRMRRHLRSKGNG